GDSVNLETRSQSLCYIVCFRALQALIVEISAATSVRDVENAVAVARPGGANALMQRVRQQCCPASISANDPHRGRRNISELNARVDVQQIAFDERQPVIVGGPR